MLAITNSIQYLRSSYKKTKEKEKKDKDWREIGFNYSQVYDYMDWKIQKILQGIKNKLSKILGYEVTMSILIIISYACKQLGNIS